MDSALNALHHRMHGPVSHVLHVRARVHPRRVHRIVNLVHSGGRRIEHALLETRNSRVNYARLHVRQSLTKVMPRGHLVLLNTLRSGVSEHVHALLHATQGRPNHLRRRRRSALQVLHRLRGHAHIGAYAPEAHIRGKHAAHVHRGSHRRARRLYRRPHAHRRGSDRDVRARTLSSTSHTPHSRADLGLLTPEPLNQAFTNVLTEPSEHLRRRLDTKRNLERLLDPPRNHIEERLANSSGQGLNALDQALHDVP